MKHICGGGVRLKAWRRPRLAELQDIGATSTPAKNTAQNRIRWKSLVSDLCSAR